MSKFIVSEYAILNDKIEKGLPSHAGDLVTITRILNSSPNYQYDVELPNGDITPVREVELNKLTDEQKELITYIKENNEAIYKPTNESVLIIKTDYLHGFVEVEFEDAGIQVVEMNTLSKLEKEIDNVIEFKFNEGDKVRAHTKSMLDGLIGKVRSQVLTDTGKKHYKVVSKDGIYYFDEGELEVYNDPFDELGYFAGLGLEVGKLVDEKQKAYGDSVTKCYQIMKVLLQDYYNNDGTYTIPESLLPQMLLDVRKIDKMNRRFSNPDGDLMGENPFQDDVGYSLLGVRMIEQLKED